MSCRVRGHHRGLRQSVPPKIPRVAAQFLLPHLQSDRRIDDAMLRAAMESALGASDADGGWTWKTTYDVR